VSSYGQEVEIRILRGFLSVLDDRVAIDVGAERGGMAAAMLEGGATSVHAIEPHPGNAAALRRRFAGDQRVTVHELAAASVEGPAELRVASGSDGHEVPFAHTLLAPRDTELVEWTETVTVQRRTLGSLVAEGALPGSAGVLKVDTEGSDLEVLRGMGALDCEVVMLEHWADLPDLLGPCPWTIEEVRATLAPHGLSRFVAIVHDEAGTRLRWDDERIEPGAWGNLIFAADEILDRAQPALQAADNWVTDRLASDTGRAVAAAREREQRIAALERERDAVRTQADELGAGLRATDAALTAAREELSAVAREQLAEARAIAARADVERREATTERRDANRARRDASAARREAESARRQAESSRREAQATHREVAAALEQQNAVLHAVAPPRRHRPNIHAAVSRALARASEWTEPRIGTFFQHAPAPVRVPRSYFRAQPPDPAPRISLVTPSLDQGDYIGRTLASVLRQLYPALEYVVMDGGSTDATRDVLERHADALAHWESAPDDGQASAINRGFARTTGDIMGYLNSDDLLLPGSLAYVASYLQAHPEVDAVYGHRYVIDDDDLHVGSWVLPPHDDEMLTLGDYVPQETLFWRRRIWERSGSGLDEQLQFAMDWDLLLRMRDAGATLVRLPRYLGAFRVHRDQKTQRLREQGEVECARLRERVHGRPVSPEEAWARLAPYLRRHVVHHTLHRLGARVSIGRPGINHLFRS
jgi:FkbM family methyltransferase